MRVTYREAEMIALPRWYGVANRNPMNLTVTVYPIPFNRVANWWVRFARWLRWGAPADVRAVELEVAESRGYRAAMERLERDRRRNEEHIRDQVARAYALGKRDTLDAMKETRHLSDDELDAWVVERRDRAIADVLAVRP